MTRLSRTYLAQMDVIQTHRPKVPQKIHVERVNGESGEQAVVATSATEEGRA